MRPGGEIAVILSSLLLPHLGLRSLTPIRVFDLVDGAIFQTNSRELPSPYTAAVDGEQVRFNVKSERRPVTGDDGRIAAPSIGNAEPRQKSGRGLVGRS